MAYRPRGKAFDSESGKEAQAKRKTKSGGKTFSVEANCNANAEQVSQAMKNQMYWFGRERVQTDDECLERLQEFFEHCMDTGEIATIEKMCLALGTTRKTVCEWEKGSKGQARAILIQQAKETIAAFDAELASNGLLPQVVYIFRAKNYHGLVEAQAVVIQSDNQTLGETVDRKTIETKYVAALPAPTE